MRRLCGEFLFLYSNFSLLRIQLLESSLTVLHIVSELR